MKIKAQSDSDIKQATEVFNADAKQAGCVLPGSK